MHMREKEISYPISVRFTTFNDLVIFVVQWKSVRREEKVYKIEFFTVTSHRVSRQFLSVQTVA